LDPTKKSPRCFQKALLIQTNKTHQKSHSFPLKNVAYYEVKSKIRSKLVLLTGHFFNETKRTATKLEGLEKREE